MPATFFLDILWVTLSQVDWAALPIDWETLPSTLDLVVRIYLTMLIVIGSIAHAIRQFRLERRAKLARRFHLS